VPRGLRLECSGVALHVIQRGNDRQACFFRDVDYRHYLALLREPPLRRGCRVHAYVLMTNHVHLLLTPDRPAAAARTLQDVGRAYVRRINDELSRTGTLWEGRFKSSMIDSERYLLACYRYIELNPVRAGMVPDPASYRWSSHACNALGAGDALISPHDSYLALGDTAESRRSRYRALVDDGIAPDELASLRLYAQRQRALGSDRFRAQIERQLARPVGLGRPGRPRKKPNGGSAG
jgi:putative transposase